MMHGFLIASYVFLVLSVPMRSICIDPLNPLYIKKQNAKGFWISSCNLSELVRRWYQHWIHETSKFREHFSSG